MDDNEQQQTTQIVMRTQIAQVDLKGHKTLPDGHYAMALIYAGQRLVSRHLYGPIDTRSIVDMATPEAVMRPLPQTEVDV